MYIQDRLITCNRPGTPLQPIGLVVHSTANPGVDAEAHYRYWDTANRDSSAHLITDWLRALTLIPWQPGRAEVAWHCAPEGNRRFLGLEICEATTPAEFERGWLIAVEVATHVLRAYRWSAERLVAHAQVSWWWGESDHMDPGPYFARYQRTWGDFVAAVDRAIRGLPASVPVPGPVGTGRPVAILDAAGRRLAEGWLQDPDGPGPEGDRTVVRVADLAAAMGLQVDWDAGGPAVTLRWPGGKRQ